MNIILTRPDFGHNTYYICDAMNADDGHENTKRLKSDEPFPEKLPEWVVRWGCTAKIPNGPKILNKRKAIQETTNKGLFRKKVADAGYAPKTWMNVQQLADDVFKGMEFSPVIARPVFHQRSEDLFFCNTPNEVFDAVAQIDGPYYISEYIEKTREYRVFVAQGRVMIVAEKLPKDRKAVTWGCVDDGGILDYQWWTDWNPALVECAVESFNLSQLDFAAIDIMEKDGRFYFLEANTAPEVWKYYGETFGKVFTYIIDNDSRERIPAVSYNNWKDCIHPALSDKATLQ